MAKKELTNRTELMKKRLSSAAADLKAADEIRTQNLMDEYIGRTQKERVTLNVRLLDDAPKSLNPYPEHTPDRMAQLKMSIMSVGILSPVIVWAKGDGRYMILAGHNRVRAVREILEEYKGLPHAFDYENVPAIVYEKDELDEQTAASIVNDTNIIQRGDLPPKLRVAAIKHKKELMKSQKDEKGRTIEEVFQDLGLKKTAIYEDIQIGTQIIEPLQDLYFDGKINRRAVLKFPMYSEDMQQWMWDEFGEDSLTSDRICQLSKKVKMKEQIREIFQGKQDDTARVRTQVTVPKDKMQEFRNLCTFYFADPAFAKMCDDYIANLISEK